MGVNILLVDQDQLYLNSAAYYLKRLGYGVMISENSDQALDIWQEHSLMINALVLRVDPENTCNLDLCRVIRASSSIPIILRGQNWTESAIIESFEVGADN